MSRVYLVDLDGTLIDSNSLNFFILTLVALLIEIKSISSIKTLVEVLFIVVARKLRFCSHDALKKKLQTIWGDLVIIGYEDKLSKSLRVYLEKVLRKDLVKYLEDNKNKDDKVVLATAAPAEYVSIIVQYLPVFDSFVSTPRISEGDWFHNISINKWKSIVSSVDLNGKEVVSFTDHSDDLPLIENSQKVYLFNPLTADIDDLKKRYKNVEFKSFYE